MQATPDFLAYLELASDAGERDVRRAYARALKQVDQERDLEGFQRLRACYEAALAWVEQREAAGEDGAADALPAPAADAQQAAPRAPQAWRDAAPEPAIPSPEALAEAVFRGFRARLAQLAARPDEEALDDAARTAPWEGALREALADVRLLNLDARLLFEQGVAALLADGWRPGHHLLLVAASGVFGWREDRRALARLGYSGTVVDAAIEQRDMFNAQTPQARKQQRDVLSTLREPALPGVLFIRQRMRTLRMLQERFPALLHVVAPGATVMKWHAIDANAAANARAGAAEPPASAEAEPPRKTGILLRVLIGIVLMLGLAYWLNHENKPAGFYPPNVEATQGNPVSQERVHEIEKLIRYKPGPDALPGEQYAQVKVFIDRDGKVLRTEGVNMGADPAFTAAVIQAIRDAGPFEPGTKPFFVLEYTVKVNASGRKEQGGSAGAQGPSLPQAYVAAIEKHFAYRPGKDAVPGKQLVMLKVRLDWEGAIYKIER